MFSKNRHAFLSIIVVLAMSLLLVPATADRTTAANDVTDTWYLAEGSTAYGFRTYIYIENPNDSAVTAAVTYMTSAGPTSQDLIDLPAKSQTTVSPEERIGKRDFSTKVEAVPDAHGFPQTICVDRRMVWGSAPGLSSVEGHSSVAVTAPATTWYLPEGSSKWGFECWLLIQNPGHTDAICTVTYMTELDGPILVQHVVPKGTRETFNMAEDIGAKDASIKVESNVPVIPERSMYRNNRREGHDSIGTTAPANDYYLAEGATGYPAGFITYALVQNPNSMPTDVTLTYMTKKGQVAGPSFQMTANSRKTIRLNDQLGPDVDVSTRVHGSQPIIAERAMYWNNGTGEACHDSIGMAAPHRVFYLPDGYAMGNKNTWTLVQNPNNTDVRVEVSYLSPSGNGNVTFAETIKSNSRKSFSMIDKFSRGGASVMVTSLTAGKKIMVERAMYWNNMGAGTDTIGGYGD